MGNHVLCTWTIMRCPALKVWATSCMSNSTWVTLPGLMGSGWVKLFRYRARMTSPRTMSWNPPIFTFMGFSPHVARRIWIHVDQLDD